MNEQTQVSLHVYRRDDVSWRGVLSSVKEFMPNATALIMGPKRCRFGILKQSGELAVANEAMEPHPIEIRLFREEAEVRWLRDPDTDDRGRAVLLTENPDGCPTEWQKDDDPRLQMAVSRDDTYLLWGDIEASPKTPGEWVTLQDHRVGAIAVPYHLSHGSNSKQRKCLLLKFREYLGPGDEFGNVAVLAERLIGFADAPIP